MKVRGDVLGFLLIASPLLLGCVGLAVYLGETAARHQQQKQKDHELALRANDLRWIGLAYLESYKRTRRWPVKPEHLDLKIDLGLDGAIALARLKAEEIVVLYGVSIADADKAGGLQPAILAYERDTPKHGGFVVYGDASVEFLNPKEFTAKLLAQK